MTKAIHPEATHHLPFFITPPGETDILMNVMMVFLALVVFLIGKSLEARGEGRGAREEGRSSLPLQSNKG